MFDYEVNLSGLIPVILAALTKVALAIGLWFVGMWLIRLVVGLITRGMGRQKLDTTLTQYIASGVSVLLKVLLIISILGHLGIETTSFAALFVAIGLAIGAAWGGLLSNLAAGAFLVFLSPFKVGDEVVAGGVDGTVREIGLFNTTIDTGDNVRTYIGNNKILAENILNYSATPYRRVNARAQISHRDDHHEAIRRLTERVALIPNVLTDPAPEVVIQSINRTGPVLAVRPCCQNDQYDQVFFDTNQVIQELFGDPKKGASEEGRPPA